MWDCLFVVVLETETWSRGGQTDGRTDGDSYVHIKFRAISANLIVSSLTGAAYGRAEDGIRRLVTRLQMPFLPTAMAKGILPDEHELCVGPARSR